MPSDAIGGVLRSVSGEGLRLPLAGVPAGSAVLPTGGSVLRSSGTGGDCAVPLRAQQVPPRGVRPLRPPPLQHRPPLPPLHPLPTLLLPMSRLIL